ncbi:SNF2 family N-terminal domain-containing protein [Daldinia decipiens]|uniref:SNF2 family N-terminal domain-containing protein n=1 Tax=Daldinia decipiens TaxID=326647 RepID=UPI0020C45762|nr:SNF2 family N-terminal domain-containing protein [Daldinia decipiens]KAI1663023.1 SNF2 family N-terminal domain-containing protein [Daldinia decipiens]
MGRPGLSQASKASVNRQNGPVQARQVRSSDPFPTDFLTFLNALPSDGASRNATDPSSDATEQAEPPRKRPRVERVEAIPIARESLTLKRPVQPEVPLDELIYRVNVNNHVKLHHDERQRILTISSNARSPYGAFKSELNLGRHEFSKGTLAILNIMSRSRDADCDEGALWVGVGVSLERKNNRDQLQLSLQLNWNSSTHLLRNSAQRALSQQVLDTFFTGQTQEQGAANEKLSPQAFYDAAFVPEKDPVNSLPLSAPKLTSKLFPFQRRALQWLLNREGVKWSDRCPNGEPGLEPLSPPSTNSLPLSFSTVKDADGRLVYISNLYHVITRDISAFRKSETVVKGGILAEEMGLGKTVETIALICMHRRDALPHLDSNTAQDERPSGATLIVTPTTLKNQWVSEFKKHAPHLLVMVYEGLKKGVSEDEQQLVSELVNHDVVITTYNVLQTEIHYAAEPPNRSMRHERKYRRPKSPLTQISWWRVCLDEAQQIESGVSSAAKVARLIPRINAWGITGTPVKTNIKDLWGLLLFLRYEPFASSLNIWEGLISTHKELFKPLFNSIALRHTKRVVRSELSLPPQKRYVITMPFNTVEEQHYQTEFKELVMKLGLDEHGSPLRSSFQRDWDPENLWIIDSMKRTLSQLRKSILHPSLGSGRLIRTADQKNKGPPTIEEVLEAMIEQSDSSIKTEQRIYLLSKLERGQLLEYRSEVNAAIQLWQEVVDEVEVLEEECRKQLQIELEKAKQAGSSDALMEDENSDMENDDDTDEKMALGKVSECRRKLRSMLDIHHRAVFFIASGYFQIKSDEKKTVPNSEEFKLLEEKEVSGYDAAKNIRKEILREARAKALSCITRIREKASSQSFTDVPEVELPSFQGLESRRVLDNFKVLAGALDDQADLIDEWRETVIQMLIRPLVDEEEEVEITGDEYEDSTKIQDELMVHTLVLRAVIADRRDAMSGLENERVKYDTRFAERQARAGEGHAPEKVLALLQQRDEIRQYYQGTSFRGIVTDLRELATKLRHDMGNGSSRARVELEIVERNLKLTQEQISAQNKAATALERELDIFTSAMNARVEYYKQLQAISDNVAPLDASQFMDLDEPQFEVQEREHEIEEREKTSKKRFTAALPKHRYRKIPPELRYTDSVCIIFILTRSTVVHLREAGQKSEEVCVICQCTFTLGVLTVCGHHFCKECIVAWLEKAHICPVCKMKLSSSNLHDITLKKQELKFHQEHPQGSSQASDEASTLTKFKKLGIYSEFSSDKLDAIKTINLNGPSFATKIDTLAKHLLWLRVEDPGAKSVIFSQFGEFLEILGRAFDQYQIGHSSFKQKNGINTFREDPAIECFLMDARAHASGLNLVNASHVFLCEPLLNTALELQAIARVDRIGQEHETTVWLYLIDGTVEESIYNLSVQRRLEHLGQNTKGKEKESSAEVSDLNLEAANSLELQQATLSKLMSKDQSMGEVVDQNDLWQCLFGHVTRNKAATDERIKDAAVIGFLAGAAAEARRQQE